MLKDRDQVIKELKKKNEDLKKEVERLEKEKDRIEKEFERTKNEFEEFKAKHAATVENLKKALKIKASKKKTSKPVGAKQGHNGYTRKIPERVDHIKALNPSKCPHCNSKLPEEASEIRSRYVTDIKLVAKSKTTQYNIHRKYCKECKKIIEQEVPGVLPHARLGLNLMLLVMYLRLGLRLPGNKVCEYFLTLHNIKISEGEVVHILKQLAREFGPYFKHLEKLVRLARVKHSDTTSWRVDGRSYNAWVFVALGVVLYRIRKRNNHKVALAVLGKKQKDKILVVDRFSAFRTLAEEAGFLLQLCWSHILDDSKGLAKNFGEEGKYVHNRLKNIYKDAKALNHEGTEKDVEDLKSRIFNLTARHYKHTSIRRFVNNLWERDAENLFRFVTDPDVDPTNNISERKLRHLVIIRKISNGSRSRNGANITAILLSVIQTLRHNNMDVFEGMKDILNNPSGY